MEITKILKVSSDYDYGVVTFEDSGHKREDVYKECVANGGKYTLVVNEEEGEHIEINFESFEFPEVPKEFLEFVENEKDYDDSKHCNWFVID